MFVNKRCCECWSVCVKNKEFWLNVSRSCEVPWSQLREHPGTFVYFACLVLAAARYPVRSCEAPLLAERVFLSFENPFSPKSFPLLLRTQTLSPHFSHSNPPFSTSILTLKHSIHPFFKDFRASPSSFLLFSSISQR